MRLIFDIEDNYGDMWTLGHKTSEVLPDDDVFKVLKKLLAEHNFQHDLNRKMSDIESDE